MEQLRGIQSQLRQAQDRRIAELKSVLQGQARLREEEEMTETEGLKFDGDKPRYDLVPVLALDEAAKVFAFGAKKYADRNWELGLNYGRLYGALIRHLVAFWGGEEYDPESGLHHLGHATCCLLMLGEFAIDGRDDLDDRSRIDRKHASGSSGYAAAPASLGAEACTDRGGS